jgi:uncharacterized protein (TIGR03435 family)
MSGYPAEATLHKKEKAIVAAFSKGHSGQGMSPAARPIQASLSHRNSNAVVVDRTGLTGDVDVSLQYARESLRLGTDTQAGQRGPSVFAALQEQLGLTLERVRIPIDYLVVDAISQPEPD